MCILTGKLVILSLELGIMGRCIRRIGFRGNRMLLLAAGSTGQTHRQAAVRTVDLD